MKWLDWSRNTPGRDVGKFYDDTSPMWLFTWGVHMHHGYYEVYGKKMNKVEAQRRLITKLLEHGHVSSPEYILDIGCGVGGSAYFLTRKYNSSVLGVTISEYQAKYANKTIERRGYQDKIEVRAMDVLDLSVDEGPFDLIWCVECLEHIENRPKLFSLLSDMLNSKGKFLITTWCLTRDAPGMTLKHKDKLEKLYKSFRWAELHSVERMYEQLLTSGFNNIEIVDWTENVTHYWSDIRKSVFELSNVRSIHKLRWQTVQSVFDLRHLEYACKAGLIRYHAFSCSK